jgi:hypothetical protein
MPMRITLKNNGKASLTWESHRLKFSKQHLFSAGLEHASLRNDLMVAPEMLICGLYNVSPPVHLICRSLLTAGRQPARLSPFPVLLFPENWKLFLWRVEWNILRTHSQTDGFISKAKHGGNLVKRFKRKKKLEKIYLFFCPAPAINYKLLPAQVYVCCGLF